MAGFALVHLYPATQEPLFSFRLSTIVHKMVPAFPLRVTNNNAGGEGTGVKGRGGDGRGGDRRYCKYILEYFLTFILTLPCAIVQTLVPPKY